MSSVPESISRPLRRVLPWQIAYAALVMGWQAVGLWRIAQGAPPLGPVASLSVAAMAAVCAGLFLWLEPRWPLLFVLLSMLCAAAAAGPLLGALDPAADPALWPSPWARYGGAALNGLGIAVFGAAVLAWLRSGTGFGRTR